jgi:hypothetical protein
MVAKVAKQPCLGQSLRGSAANSAYPDERRSSRPVNQIHFFAGERKHRFEKADLRVADCELRRVDADGDAASAGCGVVPRQRALMPLVEASVRVESQRVRGNDESGRQRLPQFIGSHQPQTKATEQHTRKKKYKPQKNTGKHRKDCLIFFCVLLCSSVA